MLGVKIKSVGISEEATLLLLHKEYGNKACVIAVWQIIRIVPQSRFTSASYVMLTYALCANQNGEIDSLPLRNELSHYKNKKSPEVVSSARTNVPAPASGFLGGLFLLFLLFLLRFNFCFTCRLRFCILRWCNVLCICF